MDNEVMSNVAEETVAETPAAPVRAVRPAANRGGKHKKVCIFCADKIDHIDYKDITRLRKCISERSKILPRRVTGACAKHQRQITVAVKRARTVALLAYVSD